MAKTCDVVVIGFGMAGLAAAITAHDAGADVLVLEKMPQDRAGGNSRVSGQVWFCPTDRELAKAHFRELAGEYPVPEEIIETWVQETARHNEWVGALAREVEDRIPRDDGDPFTGPHSEIVRRSYGEEGRRFGWEIPEHEFFELEHNACGTEYNYIGGGQGWSRLWLTLRTALEERGIRVLFDTRATRLVREQDGVVTGVLAENGVGETIEIAARKGVVVASGGFANDDELARNYLRLSYVTPWGSPGNTGDGLRMGQAVGVDMAHPYNYMAMPGIRMEPYEAGEFAQPAEARFIYVGADGRRFMNEAIEGRHGKAAMRGGFDVFPGHPMWTIFDEDGRLAGPLVWPREQYAASWMKQVERYAWSADNSAEVERGWIVRGETLRELAEKLEIDPDGLEQEVARYNAAVDAGEDTIHGRPAAQLQRIARGPYYGYRWAQLLITTLGGLRKDGDARAIDPFGCPIPGLYVAGDVASSYTWMLSGGMGLGDAMAFGRRAGAHAAAQPVRDVSELPADETVA